LDPDDQDPNKIRFSIFLEVAFECLKRCVTFVRLWPKLRFALKLDTKTLIWGISSHKQNYPFISCNITIIWSTRFRLANQDKHCKELTLVYTYLLVVSVFGLTRHNLWLRNSLKKDAFCHQLIDPYSQVQFALILEHFTSLKK